MIVADVACHVAGFVAHGNRDISQIRSEIKNPAGWVTNIIIALSDPLFRLTEAIVQGA